MRFINQFIKLFKRILGHVPKLVLVMVLSMVLYCVDFDQNFHVQLVSDGYAHDFCGGDDDDDGGGGLPAELQNRQRRVEKLRPVREQLKAEGAETRKASRQKSCAEYDANMMKKREGRHPEGY